MLDIEDSGGLAPGNAPEDAALDAYSRVVSSVYEVAAAAVVAIEVRHDARSRGGAGSDSCLPRTA